MLAYRNWRLDETGVLRSPYANHIWTGRENRAVCQQGTTSRLAIARLMSPQGSPQQCSDPPNPVCLCGFYAYPTLRQALKMLARDYSSTCIGLVNLNGRVIEHTDDTLREQYADILALVVIRYMEDSDDLADYGFDFPKQVKVSEHALRNASSFLGVPGKVVMTVAEAELWILTQEAILYVREGALDDSVEQQMGA